MAFYINIDWIYFCIVFGADAAHQFYNESSKRKHLYTACGLRKFSIIDLEFPASALELVTSY